MARGDGGAPPCAATLDSRLRGNDEVGGVDAYFRSNDGSLRDRLVGVAGGAEGLAAWPGYAAARLLARSAGPGARVRRLRT